MSKLAIGSMKGPRAHRSAQAISAAMRRVRSRNTSPEMALRRELWARGLRYRLHAKDLPGKPDIALRSKRLVVFVDGDFWHGNQWRLRRLECLEDQFASNPNADYWIPKIRRTVERDGQTNKAFAEMGWTVMRCWESEIRRDLPGCADRIMRVAKK